MSEAQCVELRIAQGKTLSRVLRWASKPFIYKAITAISKAAPARITATGHGIPAGWPVAVVSVLGMRQINARENPPGACDYRPATVIDADTVELNDVNAAEYSAYQSGGYLQFYTPASLADCTAKLVIRNEIGGTVLLTLDNGANGGIVLDDTAKTITYTFEADDSAAYTWASGVFELELRTPAGKVFCLERGTARVTPKEIAT